MSRSLSRKLLLLITLAALPLLVGSKCIFIASSGDDSDRDKKHRDDDTLVVVKSGSFGDPPAQGVGFESGSVSGSTDANGNFQYEDGVPVRFFIGDIPLGREVAGKPVITAQDLVEGGTASGAADNISRLLQSLDEQPADAAITIPEHVQTAAVRSNADVSAAIAGMDFYNDTAFANAASQLIASLTRDYPFTAMLVDANELRSVQRKTPGSETQQ